jgi:hypothetical protein
LTADNDMVWLGLGNRVVGLAASDLRQVTTATVDQPVYALATQPDGTLYAATSSTVESILTSTGASHVLATVDSTPTRLGVV